MTREEFEAQYAERSEMTVPELRLLGGRVVPCECDYSGCQGWQMQFVVDDLTNGITAGPPDRLPHVKG